jgi:hypothetical protein
MLMSRNRTAPERLSDDRAEGGMRRGWIMGRKLYAVMRHDGHWGISASNGPFLSCDSYQEALDVANNAAAILRSARAGTGDYSSPGAEPGLLVRPSNRGRY